jgi:t-SNARE complex subunit (syntaxin)
VHYINELFHDLATLVNLQQEHLDLIETNVNQTKAYTDDGKKDLEAAQEYNKSSRTVR